MSTTHPTYQAPDWVTRRVLNPTVRRLTRMGLSVKGSRVLEVPGRVSGRIQQVPVNQLRLDGGDYLVSPRGETQWVRNARAAGEVTLVHGRRRRRYRVEELTGAATLPVVRAYLRAWAWEVGAFFDGITATSTDEEMLAPQARRPVFALHVVD